MMRTPQSVREARLRVENLFRRRYGDTRGMIVAMAPGRVNLIGEHTDYNDGFVLPMTIDRAVYIGARPRADALCKMYSASFDREAEWRLPDTTTDGQQPWANYLKGVQRMLLEAGCALGGMEGVVYGDVPVGSGLSSSAAIEVAMAFVLQNLFQLDLEAVELIKLCQRAENEVIGVRCGIMDQFVSRLGKEGHALFLDCRSLHYQVFPFSFEDTALLIVDTKIKRELAGSAYNERRAECGEAVAYFRAIDPHVSALRDVSTAMFTAHEGRLSGLARRRARHVIYENERVLGAVKALKSKDMSRLGELMYESHRSLKEDYDVSCAELDWIVATARDRGSLGARLTGAGFGGCALVLSSKENADALGECIHRGYELKFGTPPAIMELVENLETAIFKCT